MEFVYTTSPRVLNSWQYTGLSKMCSECVTFARVLTQTWKCRRHTAVTQSQTLKQDHLAVDFGQSLG